MKISRKKVAVLGGALLLLCLWAVPGALAQVGQAPPLASNKIPQFVDPLPNLYTIPNATDLTLKMEEFTSPVMPTGFVPAAGVYTGTTVWGYRHRNADGSLAVDPALFPSYLGPVLVTSRGTPTQIKFVNNLPDTASSLLAFWKVSVDQTLHWAYPPNTGPPNPLNALYSGSVPAVPHLHGGEVPPELDGGPDAWWTPGGLKGHAFHSLGTPLAGEAVYRYPNTQEAANIWFHDHGLGITRLNVYAGLAGGYLITDPLAWKPTAPKPVLIPLVIQDRMFDVNGQLFFPNVGINPEHPFWVPEFVGDTIVVNGKVWPYKNVDRQRYSLLFLNGSNARTYDCFLIDPVSGVKGPPMYVIATDGGDLDNPVKVDPNAVNKAGVPKSLIFMPGERYEVIVDFNDAVWRTSLNNAYTLLGLPLPTTILNLQLRNTAKTPFPAGAPAAVGTTGRIMQFRVNMTPPTAADTSFNPATLAALRKTPIVRLVNPVTGTAAAAVTPSVKRQLTLVEIMGAGGPLEVLLNNTKYNGTNRPDFKAVANPSDILTPDTYYSELPNEGATEQWEIINMTADAHPIHLHLVQFQLMNRQDFNVAGYLNTYDLAFPGGTFLGNEGFGPPQDYNTTNAPDGAVGGNPAISPFLVQGSGKKAKPTVALPPLPYEAGWKDTVISYPGQVMRLMVRWAPTDKPISPAAALVFPFTPEGHGYVWHCHIIDHEDNEMMRPTQVQPLPVTRPLVKGTDY